MSMRIDGHLEALSEALSRVQPVQGRIDALVGDEETGSATTGELFRIIFTGSSQAGSEASAEAREMRVQLLTGQLDDLPGLMIAGQRSGLHFDLNMAIRNRIIDAYREVSQLQV